MEPLGAAASIIAVLQLSSEVVKYVNSASGATKERKRLRNELRACERILQDLHDEADDSEEGKAWSDTIKALEDPGAPLGRLYEALHSIEAKLQPKSGAKEIMASLKWPFSEREIKDLFSTIEHEKSLLEIALTNDTRKLIQEIKRTANENHATVLGAVDGLRRRMDDQDCARDQLAVLNWLSSIDYAAQKAQLLSRRQKGTGQWFLNSKEFTGWLQAEKQTIFCPGIPGAGKTIMASIVIDELATRFKNDSDMAISYAYCDFRQEQENYAETQLAVLLKQLCQGQASLPSSVKSLHTNYEQKQMRPSLDDISQALQAVALLYSKVYVIIDALDEASFEQRDLLLEALRSLQDSTLGCVYIFATARPEITAHFNEFFAQHMEIEIRATDDDLLVYVNDRLARLRRPRLSRHHDIQDTIRREVVEAADGMFLYAQLLLNHLFDMVTPGDIVAALKEKFHRGLAGLDALYVQAMERIGQQSEGRRRNALKVLSWIVHAKRQLTTSELQHAIAVQDNATQLLPQYIQDPDDLISDCTGLAVIDRETSTVRLVHYTTQQYFDGTRSRWFPDAEADITRTCITYLSFDDFHTGATLAYNEFTGRMCLYSLYDYAARYWGYHACHAPIISQEVLRFLGDQAKVKAASQVVLWHSHLHINAFLPSLKMTGLHLVAFLGIFKIVQQLLQDGQDVDSMSMKGMTPLMLAAQQGHDDVVGLLLDQGACTVKRGGPKGKTALLWAVDEGHTTTAILLLDRPRVDIDLADYECRTSLSFAASKGNVEMVDILLARGANCTTFDEDRKGMLHHAIMSYGANIKVVEKLLKSGAPTNLVDVNNLSPLHYAVFYGRTGIAELLLQHGASVDFAVHRIEWNREFIDGYSKWSSHTTSPFQDGELPGLTPLHLAAVKGNALMAQFLLDHGAQVNSLSINGETPLLLAVGSPLFGNGHNDPWKKPNFTMKYDINDDHTEEAMKRRLALIDVLLNHGKGACVSATDCDEQTALHLASRVGDAASVSLLLNRIVFLSSEDGNGQNVPHCTTAASKEHVGFCCIRTHELVNAKDTYGQTPLHLAARYGRGSAALEIVRILLDSGADANITDLGEKTPLDKVLENTPVDFGICELLLGRTDLTIPTPVDFTLAHRYGLYSPFMEVMILGLLQNKGVDIAATDSYGRTILNFAAISSSLAEETMIFLKLRHSVSTRKILLGRRRYKSPTILPRDSLKKVGGKKL